MKWRHRSCPVCSDGSYAFGSSEGKPVASILVLVSTVASDTRKQKTSGSFAVCESCLKRILSGKALPKKIRDGIARACKAIGVEVAQ